MMESLPRSLLLVPGGLLTFVLLKDMRNIFDLTPSN